MWRQSLTRFSYKAKPYLNSFGKLLYILSILASIVCLVCIIVHTGYNHNTTEYTYLRRAIRASQAIFIFNITYSWTIDLSRTLKSSRISKWIIDAAVAITLLPWIYPRPQIPWIQFLDAILYSNKFLFPILAAYSIFTLSYALFQMVGKRTNPSLLMSGSFIVFIITGTFLLMLPKCTYGSISFVDSLFVSTSAVSITGLTPVDISSTFTPLGLVILGSLIQIGALGVLTFTSFFALFFSGNASIYSQLMLKDMVYSRSMSSLVPTLLYIMGFTLIVEIIGALFIFISIHSTMGMSVNNEIAFAVFHSLSSFCNAGFSIMPGGLSNPALLHNNNSIYWITTILIIMGSIGFPILVNFRDAVTQHIKNCFFRIINPRKKIDTPPVHLYNMNTKIVIFTFSLLFIGGALLFYLFEHNHSMATLNLQSQITQSFFNSATPRSAGFSSLNPAGFLSPTLLIIMFLMWVGGASQSTGGGIKVNTLAAVWLNLRAIVTGSPKVTVYRRTVSTGSIRRANTVVTLSILSYLIVATLILTLEPNLPPKKLLFEACSALFTVGSSLGITDSLSNASKIILSIAMFIGRVGLISLLMGLMTRRHPYGITYPSDNIIIN